MTYLPWAGFVAFVIAMLAIDLGLLHRNAREIRFREAIRFSAICALLAVGFCGVVYLLYENRWLGIGVTVGQPLTGSDAALKFLTGWVLEQSLSLDNVFVIALVFKRFQVPQILQHRVLFWGILGALVFRGVMIAAGTAAIHRFAWVNYVFGAILLYAAIKMLLDKGEDVDPSATCSSASRASSSRSCRASSATSSSSAGRTGSSR
jgi:tellurite resistance protein TerC